MTFDRAYAEAKARESALDFEDLQLCARDLLRDRPDVRERASWRFRSVLVDEFQDTNRLQCELVDLLGAEELFFVGDEFQSIYRFRHADVAVFRERRASSAGVVALTRNYRSRPEVLSVVNHVFGTEFGGDFEPLVAAGRFPEPIFGPGVELLVTDKAAYRGTGIHWRVAEARHLARRVRQLVDSGEAAPGEIVLLFMAGTEAERYEEALRQEGLPTHRAAGRGYFGQQQVVDLLAYLRLLHNRYDDEALVTVLASPFVGVSNDALVLLRRATGRRPLFVGLERELPEVLDPRDRRLFEAFRQRYDRLAASAARLGLERLCERILVEHDYDLAVLARWDGRRRYANLRKLARLARSFEELRGPDVEGFVRFLRDREAAGAKEGEAVAEEEGGDAIRLLTVHAAKGLEFKVVVLADAGRAAPAPSPDEILCLPDGRFGFRFVNPVTGQAAGVFEYGDVKEAEQAADEAENRRLLYVAMTRAIDRLIVSGAVDPASGRDARAPLAWLLERLEVSLGDANGDPAELERGEARVVLRVDRALAAEEIGDAAGGGGGRACRVRAARAVRDRRVRPGADRADAARARPASAAAGRARAPAFVQRAGALRSLRLPVLRRAGRRPLGGRRRGGGSRRVGRPGRHGDRGRGACPPGARSAAGRDPRPRPRALPGGDRGRSGACRVAGGRLARVAARRAAAWGSTGCGPSSGSRSSTTASSCRAGSTSSGSSTGVRSSSTTRRTGSRSTRRPKLWRRSTGYSDSCTPLPRSEPGPKEVEVAYVFLERPDEPVTAEFARDDVAGLEAELSAAIARIHAGDFRPTPSEFACPGCPALDVVCAGPRLHAAA